ISAINSSGLHDKAQELKEEITRLSLKAVLVTEPVMLKTINNQISDKEIALGKILEEQSKSNPLAYYTIPSISYLQNPFLDEHTILITYHLAEKKLTQFIITRNSFTGIQKNTYPEFESDLQQTISNWEGADAYINTEAVNNRLYRFLLGAVNLKSIKGIIIVPDNELNYLPFEALKKDDHYLIEDHPVQYQYSTVLLKKETQDLRNLETLSFAPFTIKGYNFEDLSFKKLSFSSQEIMHNKGIYFTDIEATKNKFLSLIGKYEIIHLATHASSNSRNNQLSYIAFAPWNDTARESFLLFAPEIYNLTLKRNRLIILSACETSNGGLVKGEGVMSLSRAFEYSGCQNIISSLWKADDEATSVITQKLHNYLNKGESIAEALQMAKKDYLSDPRINPRRKNPAYWAHLIYTGNYKPSSFNTTRIWTIIIIAFAIGILISMKAFRNKVARKKS
ncbi:MAG TPA: CHAT domain-containing protein, partial [Candidatus Nitrosocosmicus sp.]